MSTLIGAGIAIVMAVLGIMWRLLANAKKSGIDEKEAEDAEAERAHIQRIQDAKRAGDSVDPGSVYDDPYNRTRTKGPSRP